MSNDDMCGWPARTERFRRVAISRDDAFLLRQHAEDQVDRPNPALALAIHEAIELSLDGEQAMLIIDIIDM